MTTQVAADLRAAEMFRDSVARYGIEHTHDATCRTWRGQNWMGACDCTLPARDEAAADAAEASDV